MSIMNHMEKWDVVKRKVKCYHCGKQYMQRTEDQVPGFRDREYDICPYCHEENGSSMEVEYFNYKIGE